MEINLSVNSCLCAPTSIGSCPRICSTFSSCDSFVDAVSTAVLRVSARPVLNSRAANYLSLNLFRKLATTPASWRWLGLLGRHGLLRRHISSCMWYYSPLYAAFFSLALLKVSPAHNMMENICSLQLQLRWLKLRRP